MQFFLERFLVCEFRLESIRSTDFITLPRIVGLFQMVLINLSRIGSHITKVE